MPQILKTKSLQVFDTIVLTIDSLNIKFPSIYFAVLYIPSFFMFCIMLYPLLLTVIKRLLPFVFIRAFTQLYKTTVANLSNFEFTFFLLSSLTLYILMLLISSDDIFEQVSELFLSNYFLLFSSLIIFLFFLYSVHVLAFIALSSYSRRSLIMVARQFKNDVLDLISLLLRFYVLLFRLNVYDLLEDLFDGYYIFLGDFGDEYLLNTTLLPIASLDGFNLGTNDEISDFEDTNSSLWFDIFSLYYFL